MTSANDPKRTSARAASMSGLWVEGTGQVRGARPIVSKTDINVRRMTDLDQSSGSTGGGTWG